MCVVPVVGFFDHRPARCDQPGIRPQGLGESGVPAGALAGQQVVIDRLADESVPEGISVAADDQHVSGHRRPQRAGQSVVFQAGHRGQQGVLDLGPGRTRRPQDALGFLGEPVHRGQQQIAQRLGQLRVRLAVTAQQLLHEQRVALSAPVDLVGHGRRQFVPEDPRRELVGLQPGQPRQLYPLYPAESAKLGQQRAYRMGAVQVIGPEGDDDQYPVQHLLAADQERQQVAGRTVSPVRVLDDQHDRPLVGQVLQQRENLLEQPGPGHAGAGIFLHHAELRQQPGHLAGGLAGQQAGHAVGTHVPHEFAQHRAEGRERQPFGTYVEAGAGQHPGPGIGGARGELGGQPGLSDSRLAADEHGGRRSGAGAGQRGVQYGQVLTAAD